jgi:hypothetical protein
MKTNQSIRTTAPEYRRIARGYADTSIGYEDLKPFHYIHVNCVEVIKDKFEIDFTFAMPDYDKTLELEAITYIVFSDGEQMYGYVLPSWVIECFREGFQARINELRLEEEKSWEGCLEMSKYTTE